MSAATRRPTRPSRTGTADRRARPEPGRPRSRPGVPARHARRTGRAHPTQEAPPPWRRSTPSGSCGLALTGGRELDLLVVGAAYDHPLDEDAGKVDAVGVERARGDHFLYLDHAHLAACRGGEVEVARRLAEHAVAGLVGLPCLDDRKVGEDPPLEQVLLAVEDLSFLALGDGGADAGLGVEARNARAARAHALGQRALRAELDLELAGEELPLELLVLADVGADHLPDLPGAQELADAFVVDAGVVAGERQVPGPARLDRLDQALGNAAQAEPARGDQQPVAQDPVERRRGVGIKLLH